MDRETLLSQQFEQHRDHLRAVATRILGSPTEAEDATQEAWVRLQRSDVDAIENLGGWLTTVVARISLNLLRSRDTRRSTSLDDAPPRLLRDAAAADPEADAETADGIGLAMLVVLDTLNPAERVAFVLHDMFAVPFDELAEIIATTPSNARQLASRARRHVRGSTPAGAADDARRRDIVDAFLAASRHGDFARLLAVLDPDVSVRADDHAVRLGSPRQLVGSRTVVESFVARARAVRPALVDGAVTLVSAPDGVVRVLFDIHVVGDIVRRVDVITDPITIAALAPELLPET